MLLHIPQQIDGTEFDKQDISLITVPASAEYAQHHGACRIAQDRTVKDIIYKVNVICVERLNEFW